MKHLAITGLCLAMTLSSAWAQVNAGDQKSEQNLPFTVTEVTTLRLPWRIAFLPDGRMLITEKVGGLALVSQDGAKVAVANVPAVEWKGQAGMLGVYLSPHYAKDHSVYLTYSEPGEFGSNPQGEAGEKPALSRNCIVEAGLSVRRSQVACPCSRPMPFAEKGEDL